PGALRAFRQQAFRPRNLQRHGPVERAVHRQKDPTKTAAAQLALQLEAPEADRVVPLVHRLEVLWSEAGRAGRFAKSGGGLEPIEDRVQAAERRERRFIVVELMQQPQDGFRRRVAVGRGLVLHRWGYSLRNARTKRASARL